MSIQVEVWGDYACFSRPELKVERVSYDVMTPSAARGIIESIYWHPGLEYKIDKIYVLNPIRFINVRRNEVEQTVVNSRVLETIKKGGEVPQIYTQLCIQQRSALILRDVHYVIDAHFILTNKAAQSDNPGKFQDILRRRLNKGQCYSQPYLGCREFAAHFREWSGGEIPALDLNQNLGVMLYDKDYTNPNDVRAEFFDAKLNHGVLDCRRKELYK